MLTILNSLNAHNFPFFEPILVSKFMVYRVLSDKTNLSLGLLSPLRFSFHGMQETLVKGTSEPITT